VEFARRLKDVPAHGLGLSVDVYSPDLASLLRLLRERRVDPGYLEAFRATAPALTAVRNQVGDGLLTYHGEGLWLTQPEVSGDQVFMREICEVAKDLQILQSAWLNHECATKHIAGYSFGTYLPPLYTQPSADVVAENAVFLQTFLDRSCCLRSGCSPLVLLEMPPLTYFVTGTVPIPTFFRLVTEGAPCGLVLDVGHLWTVYRYTRACKTTSLLQFVDAFLAEFPLERVVEIHVAGLSLHESSQTAHAEGETIIKDRLPAWTDAHAAPIPPVLFDMLDRILNHPRLTSLKGLALEVDTKSVGLIVDEFESFLRRYAGSCPISAADTAWTPLKSMVEPLRPQRHPVSDVTTTALKRDYERYAMVVVGRSQPEGAEWHGDEACIEELERYRSVYLPYEILHWGGDIPAMFPESCRQLAERAVRLSKFVTFWFREPRPVSSSYDFFLLKIARFVEFVHEEAPDLDRTAVQEAEELREAYQAANEPAGVAARERI
jgi:uncharacterized protein (UPF0276 family)